jgi:hypothetical protein
MAKNLKLRSEKAKKRRSAGEKVTGLKGENYDGVLQAHHAKRVSMPRLRSAGRGPLLFP